MCCRILQYYNVFIRKLKKAKSEKDLQRLREYLTFIRLSENEIEWYQKDGVFYYKGKFNKISSNLEQKLIKKEKNLCQNS
tara:strand:- start:246 stop:485 length:240 start_codon:yes stop_codon:yes gene_type:complete